MQNAHMPVYTLKSNIGELNLLDLGYRGLDLWQRFGQRGYQMSRGLRRKMYENWRIQIPLKILDDELYIFHVRPYQVYHSHAMQLLSILVNVKIESDVVLSEIFYFEKTRYCIMVCLVKDYYLPCAVFLPKNFLKK
jgi:hypothetical protein